MSTKKTINPSETNSSEPENNAVKEKEPIPVTPRISKYLVSANDKKGSSIYVKAATADEALRVWAKRFSRDINNFAAGEIMAKAINITDKKENIKIRRRKKVKGVG